MPIQIQGKTYYYKNEALEDADVTKSTWRRWFKNGNIEDVKTRDRKGWCLFTEEDIKKLKEYNETIITE